MIIDCVIIHDYLTEKGKGKFVRLRKDAVPSLNLPKRSLEVSPSDKSKNKRLERSARLTKRRLLFER
jgi:hypothetical protein